MGINTDSLNASPLRQILNRRNMSVNNDTQPIKAFVVIPGIQKPSPSRWYKNRLEDLILLPKHKPPRDKRTMLPPHLRNNSPMTMEDKSYKHTDLDLRNGLRSNIYEQPNFNNTMTSLQSGTLNKSGQQNNALSQTIPNPPSFYDDDIDKWRKKFHKQVQERQTFKKLFYQTQELTPLTKNTNVLDQTLLYQNTALPNEQNTYKRVMQRRKSRQSTYAPLNLDIDYVGDSGKFYHLIQNRSSNQGSPTSSQLNFEMKLRNYKNDTAFKGQQPWQYPPQRQFQASNQYKVNKDELSQTLGDFKFKYNDNFPEKNQYHTRELMDKHVGIMQSTFWEFNLRGDRKNKAHSQKKALNNHSKDRS